MQLYSTIIEVRATHSIQHSIWAESMSCVGRQAMLLKCASAYIHTYIHHDREVCRLSSAISKCILCADDVGRCRTGTYIHTYRSSAQPCGLSIDLTHFFVCTGNLCDRPPFILACTRFVSFRSLGRIHFEHFACLLVAVVVSSSPFVYACAIIVFIASH